MSNEELKKYYEISISEESLKKITKREELREKYSVEMLAESNANLVSFEQDLASEYSSLNKYKVYHVALFDDDSVLAKIPDIKAEVVTTDPQLFEKPYVNKGLYEVLSSVEGSQFSFAVLVFKDKIRAIRDDVTGLITDEERYKILYMYKVDIVKLDNSKVGLIISLPTYRERTGSLYYFGEEIKFIYDIFEGFGVRPKPFALKDFFNQIPKDNEIKTQGFHGKSFVSPNGDIPIEIKYKRETFNVEEYQDFFNTIDDTVQSEIVSSLLILLVDQLYVDASKADDLAKDLASNLTEYGVSESVVSEMKVFSKDGAGWLFYKEDGTVKQYSLLYNKVYPLQIRSTHEGWSNFVPLLKEIKTYIK